MLESDPDGGPSLDGYSYTQGRGPGVLKITKLCVLFEMMGAGFCRYQYVTAEGEVPGSSSRQWSADSANPEIGFVYHIESAVRS